MKIKKIIHQHRRDFFADMECEHCGHVEPDYPGYDDDHFHRNVIPEIRCKSCGKSSGEDYRPLTTKYPENQQV